jgi:cyclic beta-1,2-glucan synthetase
VVKKAVPADERQSLEPRRLRNAREATHVHLLSNGQYHVMLTGAGSGYSRWHDIGVTRWREDVTRDDWGSYFFLRDLQSGAVWSATEQPCEAAPDEYAVTLTECGAKFSRKDNTLTTTLEVVLPEADAAEGRRLCITNTGNRSRELEITSFAEMVLAAPSADSGHPAFLKMFVETERVRDPEALLATRRRRSPDEPIIWAAHHAVVEGDVLGEPEVETDRARFLGRGREVGRASSIIDGKPLSNSAGTVIDTVFALRYRVRVAAGETAQLCYWTSIASSREDALALVGRQRDRGAFARAQDQARQRALEELQRFEIDAGTANEFQRLAGYLLYANAALRSAPDVIRDGSGPPGALWAQGIGGDLPILLLQVADNGHLPLLRQMLRAHQYWRSKGLGVDLVILNSLAPSGAPLQAAVEAEVRASQARASEVAGIRGGVVLLRADTLPEPTRNLLLSAARVVLDARRGTLTEQLDRVTAAATGRIAGAAAAATGRSAETVRPGENARAAGAASTDGRGRAGTSEPHEELEFFNGLGGFAHAGREYVTVLAPGETTPAPWVNVITNPHFGTQVSADGGCFTWSRNSRERQLTPWSNDPVVDRPGEVLYLRDKESGELWSATASPAAHPAATYVARHGRGYSRFEHSADGLAVDLLVFVSMADPVKISRLRIRNGSTRPRTLTVTAYTEWVLGSQRGAAAPFILTQLDADSGAMFARNPWDAAYGSRVAFADLAGKQTQWTADRGEFLGRHGTLRSPAALAGHAALSGRAGAGLDPCSALQTSQLLQPGETAEVIFLLGESDDATSARNLLTRIRQADLESLYRQTVAQWDELLSSVQVRTPERTMDIILNQWMLYQAIACRIWARTAFYQASGAYGFRDQLQDSMAVIVTRPDLTREHLLRAAGRQFPQGDLQHWWLVPLGQGVRTRIADDTVWLAYCAHHYIETTGDLAVLDERIAFLKGRELKAGEHDAFYLPEESAQSASLFEHCARALDHSLKIGEHGLPLFGTGDWNDGMNRVGEGGRGESVWLGWFLHYALSSFAPLAAARGELAREQAWRAHAAALQKSLELAWDGDWYRRGYFDDGTALGSAASSECRIDSIAQSWSVMSGAGDSGRARRAMASVESQLVRPDPGLVLLFTPPFDRIALDPGYIKGYPPGLRENGGQYTHAATWAVIAQAMLGNGEKAAHWFSLLNPINHTRSPADIERYRVEPYVVAADIYSVPPNEGRGGWTWYTGSAGWMYRAGLEWILGFRVRAGKLLLQPCIPPAWRGFEITYRHGAAHYEIVVENPRGVSQGVGRVELDGQPIATVQEGVPLVDDGRTHRLRVVLGPV